jgi:putative restriction endonuclease
VAIEAFRNQETDYLAWVVAHPDGFVANVGATDDWPQYPMVHSAKHKAISSPARSNYTSGKYFKVCAETLNELEGWSKREYRRSLTRCAVCFK